VPLGGFLAVGRELRGKAPGVPPVCREKHALVWVLFASIVLLALFLRLHTAFSRPAWDDEMWTLRNVFVGDMRSVIRISLEDYWPPLHYLILNLVARVADTGLVMLRLPSIAFGVATVAVMPLLGRGLFGRWGIGLIGALFLSLMTSHILYSQEGRVYSLQILLAVLSAHFFYRSFWAGRVSLAFVVSTSLLTYSHSFSTFFFLASEWTYVLLATLLWRRRDLLKAAVFSQAIVMALLLPLVIGFLHVRFTRGLVVPTDWSHGASEIGLFQFMELYQSLSVRSWAAVGLQGGLFLLAILGLVGGGLCGSEEGEGGNEELPGDRFRKGVVFLLAWITAPILASALLSKMTSLNTFGLARYHLTVLPGMCLLAAAGFALIWSRVTTVVGVMAVLAVGAHELPDYFTGFTRPAMDEAAEYLRAERRPGEEILAGRSFRVLAFYLRGSYPRLGSDEWKAFEASFSDLTEQTTDDTGRFASRYSVEKIPPYLHWVRYRPPLNTPWQERSYTDFLTDARSQGLLEPPFWVAAGTEELPLMVSQLDQIGVRCSWSRERQFRDVEVRYCGSDP